MLQTRSPVEVAAVRSAIADRITAVPRLRLVEIGRRVPSRGHARSGRLQHARFGRARLAADALHTRRTLRLRDLADGMTETTPGHRCEAQTGTGRLSSGVHTLGPIGANQGASCVVAARLCVGEWALGGVPRTEASEARCSLALRVPRGTADPGRGTAIRATRRQRSSCNPAQPRWLQGTQDLHRCPEVGMHQPPWRPGDQHGDGDAVRTAGVLARPLYGYAPSQVPTRPHDPAGASSSTLTRGIRYRGTPVPAYEEPAS